MPSLDIHVLGVLSHYRNIISTHFNCPVLSYTGPIHPAVQGAYVAAVEEVVRQVQPTHAAGRICIVLATPGGVVEAVEKMVEVTRHHFSEVFFVVPTAAMSAGTIFCMSGDKIFMDYTSSLGPIDPQVPLSDGHLVPALGYIDKVNELIDKSAQGKLTDAEFMMLQRLDLATLRRYEQARDLSVSLLKQWLVKYKFKDWAQHSSTNPGQAVTDEEKEQRAEQIAKDLSDNNRWHSHGRMIGINTLTSGLKLKIEDYTQEAELRQNLRVYSELLAEHAERQQSSFMLHYN
ncbi:MULTISPECIES: serine dehydrogenasease [unclassified Pseudomonas]|uniref:SDH family Clp fold serine proteinase n=1 Tax=unclassified Pseudomonas TaxID=196821 RepID=UPI000C88E5F3|nr:MULTISPECIES: serine dehydrogenasease [unclassified Pseudomonas]PMX24583.1 serine dehydrogenasease [Pseudomonas sp. GW460-12]PMX32860.1 serine dehydrogenasease [Pseudomonas sp. MPR-R2A4]PMX40001.1 serine dehydrogenasease [Pseudomonas sp. MPR-R2A7]PMX52430.1 serine dehydrogenasease [Pseudomonas sp. MPR-R2A6]PMX89851.1 serine dehydrogenasease [Pseudomonas sp. MPR-R2A3]